LVHKFSIRSSLKIEIFMHVNQQPWRSRRAKSPSAFNARYKVERSFHALCCPRSNYFGDKEIFYSFPWRQARAETQAEDLIIRGGRMKGKKWVFKALLSLSFCDHRLFKRKLYCWMMETWWKGLSLFKYYIVRYYFGTTLMNSNVLTWGNATIVALDASI
jgi:hypothetical protein